MLYNMLTVWYILTIGGVQMPKLRVIAQSVMVAINPLYLRIAGFEVGDEVVIDAKKGQITIKKAKV